MATQRTPSARTDNWLYTYGEVIGAVDLAIRLVRLAADVVATMQVDIEALAASAGDHFSTATDLAEQLVLERGLDYRSSYRVVGMAVADATELGEDRLGADHLERAARLCGIELTGSDLVLGKVGDVDSIIASRDVPGGSAPRRVIEHGISVLARVEESLGWATAAKQAEDTAIADLLSEVSALEPS